ncbi:hypothetical protein [Parafrankia sp. EUN1f]|nr:hypothetical protein [Parafrankia sp. EUN1f]
MSDETGEVGIERMPGVSFGGGHAPAASRQRQVTAGRAGSAG